MMSTYCLTFLLACFIFACFNAAQISFQSPACPVLFVDAPRAPFLTWRLLTKLQPENSSNMTFIQQTDESMTVCRLIRAFTQPYEKVCFDLALIETDRPRKPWRPPHDRTLDLRRNKPDRRYYPNAKKSQIITLTVHKDNVTAAWKRVQNHINKFRLYDPDDNAFLELMNNMNTLPIIKVDEPAEHGTWFKLFFTLSDGTEVLFKPQRFDRAGSRQNPDTFYFSDYERHNAEIAAFHVDKVLGFHWVPPTIGRVINLTRDVQKLADKKLNETIYISPAGNKCVHGNCAECKLHNAVCGSPDLLEGSFQFILPYREEIEDAGFDSPYARTYWKRREPSWINDLEYCHQVDVDYHESRLLLDIMDIAIFDFLTGNQDRHHLHFFPQFLNDSFPIMFDNGRAFGRPDYDDELILTPIVHCCYVRYSTLVRLMKFHQGKPKKLSQAFDESSRADAVYPLLTDDFLVALDRRVGIIISKIEHCVRTNKFQEVVIDDVI